MKLAIHIALLLVTLFFWKGFVDSGNEITEIQERLEVVDNNGDPEDQYDSIEKELRDAEAERLFMGLLLTVGSCVVGGIFVWAYLLPFLAQRATSALYDSGEMLEEDPLREAHSLLAQGEFEDAFKAFRKVADEDPTNRLPWVEMAKVQRQNLDDPNAAVAVLREALEAHEWEQDDAAFLLFRLAEVYDEDLEDRVTGRGIMQQVIDTFPESRHSANATHKLHEWDREDEEKEFMNGMGS